MSTSAALSDDLSLDFMKAGTLDSAPSGLPDAPVSRHTADALPAVGADGKCPLDAVSKSPSAVMWGMPEFDPETTPVPVPYLDELREKPRAALSIKVLATVAVAVIIVLARDVLMPVTVAFLLALTLRPLVRRARKLGLPEGVSALLLLGSIVFTSLAGISSVIEPARQWATSAPAHMRTVENKLKSLRAHWAAITDTTAKMQKLATDAAGDSAIAVELHEGFLAQPIAVATNTGHVLANCLMVLVLTFFILVSGDRLLNQVLTNLPRLTEKKRTVQLIRNMEQGIAQYLFTISVINAGLGIVCGVIFWMLKLPNPALWGAMVFAFNYVPFFGPFVCTIILMLVSLLSFDSVAYAFVPPIVFTCVAAVEGNLITPIVLGRSMSLNPIIVFIALIAGGWAWGLGGAILAVPLLAATRVGAEIFDSTRPIARLLAE